MPQYFTKKQPWEAYYVRFDLANVFGATEDVASATVTAIDLADGSDVSTTLLDVTKQNLSGTDVNVWVRAGTADHDYKITCKATGDAGSKFELEGVLPVRET